MDVLKSMLYEDQGRERGNTKVCEKELEDFY